MGLVTVKDSRPAGVTLVPNDFIDFYMPRANGEFVKIYLYLLRNVHEKDCTTTLSHIADIFSCTEKDVLRALRYWKKSGILALEFQGKERELKSIELLPITPALTITQADPEETDESADEDEPPRKMETSSGKPRPQAQISASRMKELKDSSDPSEADDVRTILMFTERYLGKPLSNTDMRRILYFYDVLHFPVDLIDYLVDYSVSHDGRSLNYIEKVGLAWNDEGITTVKAAKEQSDSYKKKYFAIFQAFGIRNRNPISDEIKDMDRWLNTYGFSIDIIKEAASRTIAQTGRPNFRYADKILSSWHDAGVRTAEDIARLDEAHQQANKRNFSERTGKYRREISGKSGNGRGFNDNFQQRDYDFDKLEEALLNSQEKQTDK